MPRSRTAWADPADRSGRTVRTPAGLVGAGLVPADRLPALEQVAARYAVAITPEIVTLIDPADPTDPIARQFVPQPAELDEHAHEQGDPIGDEAHSPLKGIVHRYPDRVLLKPVHVCPVYCRFCFRREAVGPHGAGSLSEVELEAALAYIAGHPAIWEVIVTGGDPLILSPRRLAALMRALARAEHVRVVRFHSRVPVVDPGRVTPDLARALRVEGKATYVVLHANHPRELTPEARAAAATLIDAGIPMLSQSVLLRGVNDEPDTLAALMRVLVETRIKPYYLHHADLAPGTAHLRTSIAEGQRLMRHLRGRHSGLCQPTYVLDIPGGHGKSPIGPSYLPETAADAEPADTCRILDYRGRSHRYPGG